MTEQETLTFESRMIRWLNALESDRYEQTTGMLKQEGVGGKVAYCCLGVYVEAVENGNFQGCRGGALADGTHPQLLNNEVERRLHLDELVTPEEKGLGELVLPTGEQWRLSHTMDRQAALAGFNDAGVDFRKTAQFIRYVGWDKEDE